MSTRSISKTEAGAAVNMKKHKRQSNVPYYLMLLPGLIVLLINNYLPMIGVTISFENYRFDGNVLKSMLSSQFVGFDNFKFLFSAPDIGEATRNTVLYNLAFIVLDVVIPVALAIAMSELWSKRFSKFYQSVAFLPYFLSWIIISYLVYALLSYDNGLLNRFVVATTGGEPVDWYNSIQYWPGFLIEAHLWKWTGYNLVVYLAAISGISGDYYEAAALDGASKWQQIRYITLPMLKTVIVIMTLMAVGRIFNSDFGLFFNIPRNNGSLYSATQVIDTLVYNMLSKNSDVSMTAAAGLYQAFVGCLTVLTANFIVRKVDRDSALF